MSGDDLSRIRDDGHWCRRSLDSPCSVEQQLREGLAVADLRLATTLHDAPGSRLPGTVLCSAALRGGEAACAASAFLARHHGLEVALRLRFAATAVPGAPRCELVLQPGAADRLSATERVVLLQVAEQVVLQVDREGSAQVRLALRRSRLGTVDLSIAGDGRPQVEAAVAESYRSLALARRLALQVDARVAVRRLGDGSLFVRCGTRWQDADGSGD